MSPDLAQTAADYLGTLCVKIPSRSIGSSGNRAATEFFAERASAFGFETQCPAFDCMEWTTGGATLKVDSSSFEVFSSPYSAGCQVIAPLVVVSTVAELEDAQISEKVVLLRGEIAKEQLMPKNFPFYNPDDHKHIVELLERKQPCAIVTATTKDAAMAGGVYPFALIEDGDFDIPSVYVTAEEGNRLAAYGGSAALLESKACRVEAKGCNVVARKGAGVSRRVVFFAHIDAKLGTPGALDNASGIVTLLLLAELLEGYSGGLGIEIVALNGEDYYSAPGEQLYLSMNAEGFGDIALGVNLDGAGYRIGKTAYSLYECPPALATVIHETFMERDDLVEGEPWYQGDHGLFLMNQRPALAITSERAMQLLAEVIHTSTDRPELVETTKLVEVAVALRDLVLRLDRSGHL